MAPEPDDKEKARQWTYDLVMTGVRNPDRVHRDSVDSIGIIFAQPRRRVGDCRPPIHAGPTAAAQFFEMRAVVSDRRIPINQWHMGSPNAECREYYEVARRNVDRARKRLGCKQARIRAGNGADIRDAKGNVAHEPSDRVLIPPVSNEALAAHTLFPALDPTWNSERDENTEWACPNLHTPRREGGILPGPNSTRVQTRKLPEKARGKRHSAKRMLWDFQILMSSLLSRGNNFAGRDKNPIGAGRLTPPCSPWEIRQTLSGIPFS